MALGGWYYVSASNFQGPNNAVQIKKGGTYISGSSGFTFDPATNIVTIDGALVVSGEINYGAMSNNQTTISTDTTIAANSRAVLYTDDDNRLTVADGKKLEILAGAKAILKEFPLS